MANSEFTFEIGQRVHDYRTDEVGVIKERDLVAPDHEDRYLVEWEPESGLSRSWLMGWRLEVAN